jgi:hypothetical protein
MRSNVFFLWRYERLYLVLYRCKRLCSLFVVLWLSTSVFAVLLGFAL